MWLMMRSGTSKEWLSTHAVTLKAWFRARKGNADMKSLALPSLKMPYSFLSTQGPTQSFASVKSERQRGRTLEHLTRASFSPIWHLCKW